MIIISQNQDEIINFDNVMSISIFDCENGQFALFAAFIVGRDDNYRELGYYESEERAKEVLSEILKNVNSQKFFLKPKINSAEGIIEDAKKYFEKINNIDLVIEDNAFEITPINSQNVTIYQMPKE